MKAAVLRFAVGSIMLVAAYVLLLCFPEPLFSSEVIAGNLILYSDLPIRQPAATHVLDLVQLKLQTSPLYSINAIHRIYMCNSRWRQRVFFSKDYGVGGLAPYPWSPNVFLRDARIEDNRLISPLGMLVAGDRTLDYFIAHEITHQLTGHALGPLRYARLPQWVREGYADYVGKGGSFQYNEARQAFLANAQEMDYQRSGLYRRFHLLVAHMLDRRHVTVEQLLKLPPTQESVEAEIRAGN